MKILKKIFFQKKKENETSLPKINPKNYKKPIFEIIFIDLEDVVLNSGINNDGTLDSFDPDETWTIFDGGQK